jgi:hypothetical protein
MAYLKHLGTTVTNQSYRIQFQDTSILTTRSGFMELAIGEAIEIEPIPIA